MLIKTQAVHYETPGFLMIPSDLIGAVDLEKVKGSSDSNVLTFSPARQAA